MPLSAVSIDPETMGGTPVFAGTRVPIQSLWDYLETGETLDEFLENFPTVGRALALEVLEAARELVSRAAVRGFCRTKTCPPSCGSILAPPTWCARCANWGRTGAKTSRCWN